MKVKSMLALACITLCCTQLFGQNEKKTIQAVAMPKSKRNSETVEVRRASPIENYITYSATGEQLYMVEINRFEDEETHDYYKWENYQWVTDPDYTSPSIYLWQSFSEPSVEIIDGQFRFYRPGIGGSYYTYWDWSSDNTYSEVRDNDGRLLEVHVNGYKEYSMQYDNLGRLTDIYDYNWDGISIYAQTQYEYYSDTHYKTLMDWTRYDSEKGQWMAFGWKEIRTYERQELQDGYRMLTISAERYIAENGTWSIGDYRRETTYDSDGDVSFVYHYAWTDGQWTNDMYSIAYPNENTYLSFNNTLLKYQGEGGDVVIPYTLGITAIGGNAFSGNQEVTSVVIPTGIQEIGQSAFMNCEKLEIATLPNTVTTIKEEAFFNTSLETVSISNAVKTIGAGAFGACETLTEIKVSSSNTSYAASEGVLYNKSKETLHTYPGGLEGSFSIPNTVKEISNEAFYGSKITAVSLNDKTQSIGEKAFGSCKELTSIDIPSSVSSIGQSAFENSSKLEAINVSGSNTNYSSNEGVLFNKDKTQLITSPENKPGAAFEIPSSVTIIKENAFQNNVNLTEVEIPSSVKEIQNLAFSNCSELKNVTVKWKTPLSVPEDLFKGIDTEKIMLHVPEGQITAYKNAAVWKNFKITSSPVSTEHVNRPTLQARLTGGILHIAGLNTGEIINVYNINGQCVYQGTAQAENVQISLTSAKGVFVVTAGKKSIKVVEN